MFSLCSSTHQRMLSFLAQSEFAMTKAAFVYQMNIRQMDRYRQLQVSGLIVNVFAI